MKGEELAALLALLTFGYFVFRKPSPPRPASSPTPSTWPTDEPVHTIPPEPTFTA